MTPPPVQTPHRGPQSEERKVSWGLVPQMWQKWDTAWGWACPWQVAAQVSLLSPCTGKSHLQLVPICIPFGVSSPAPWLSPHSHPTLPTPQAPVHPCWPHHGPSAFSHFLGPTKLGVSHPAAWASAPRSPRRGAHPDGVPWSCSWGSSAHASLVFSGGPAQAVWTPGSTELPRQRRGLLLGTASCTFHPQPPGHR